MFNKFAEQAWDEKGNPIQGKLLLSKKGARKYATEVLAKWDKLDPEETESYI